MKIVILGGSGFIGSRLARQLIQGGRQIQIFDLKRPEFECDYTIGDIRDLAAVRAVLEGQDVVYNLAAEHADNVTPVSKYYDVNVNGAKVVCDAASDANVQSIYFTSSVAVYGESNSLLRETSPHLYTNEYGRTKSLAEGVYTEWCRQTEWSRLVIVRPTVVFGPGNRGNVYNLMSQIANRRFVMIGRGGNKKSIAYVENVADFLTALLSADVGHHCFNYADKPDLCTRDLVRLIRDQLGIKPTLDVAIPPWLGRIAGSAADVASKVAGRPLPISRVRVEKFMANTEVDASTAFEWGFSPAVPLSFAIQRTIEQEFLSTGVAA